MTRPLRFGIFLAPFHPPGQNPTLAIHRDLALVEHLDRVGFDEAWIGEHHSAGYEIIASPEVFIAAASQRTSRIKLGTGVSSLPYHHPLMLADRMVLLDHLTRGRVMLGVGPGSLPSDAFMMGIEVARQRDMMEESLEVILALLAGETVTHDSGADFEVAVAAMVSPSGPRAAGRFGCSLLSIGATQVQGYDLLGTTWQIMEERAAAFEKPIDRANWRLVGPVHLAATKEQAYRDVEYGLAEWVDYFTRVAALPLAPETDDTREIADAMNDSGFAVIGTPDDLAAQLERLEKQSGGFGTFLNMAHDWASPQATLDSYTLMAREVFPAFQASAGSLTASRDWAAENRPEFMAATTEAIMTSFAKHQAEQEAATPDAGA